jgi:hypothetical protein
MEDGGWMEDGWRMNGGWRKEEGKGSERRRGQARRGRFFLWSNTGRVRKNKGRRSGRVFQERYILPISIELF